MAILLRFNMSYDSFVFRVTSHSSTSVYVSFQIHLFCEQNFEKIVLVEETLMILKLYMW